MRLFSRPTHLKRVEAPPTLKNAHQAVTSSVGSVLTPIVQRASTDESKLRYMVGMAARMLWFSGHHFFVQSFLLKDNRFLRSLHPETLLSELTGQASFNSTAAQMIHERNSFFSSLLSLMQEDMINVASGRYKMPLELQCEHFIQHFNLSNLQNQIATFHADAQISNTRREERNSLEVRSQFPEAVDQYPEYYLQNFHYQTDGWLSHKSAELYDYQVESLFCGGANLMRRQLLPSILKFKCQRQGQVLREQRSFQHLDLACGTGRLASALLDNDPSIECTLSDLSPFYLDEAKRQMQHRHPHAEYVAAAAEKLPFPDSSFDSISCVYLFHELPQEVRVQVLKEIKRVLRPGGKLFFMDSVQQDDVPYKQVLEDFDFYFHEPYYREYTTIDLEEMFEDAGLKVESTNLHWISKSVVASA